MPADPSRSPTTTGAGDGARLTIGKVIALLEPEFPDLAVSKIRFLEAEGLLSPERSGSGYRRYSARDVERLRYILTAQRDHFWPLKVIRDALEAQDRGSVAPAAAEPPLEARLTAEELTERTSAPTELLAALEAGGLISRDAAGCYSAEDQSVVEAVVWLQEFGVEPRHVRPIRTAADRQVSLVEQMLAPSAPGRERQARAGQMAQRLLDIHVALVRKGISGLR